MFWPVCHIELREQLCWPPLMMESQRAITNFFLQVCIPGLGLLLKDEELESLPKRLMNRAENISPTWTHRGCGGVVFVQANGQAFACRKCQQSGQPGADIPPGMTYDEQIDYLLTQVKELDLVPIPSGFFFLGPA
jgi:hypothetical protein